MEGIEAMEGMKGITGDALYPFNPFYRFYPFHLFYRFRPLTSTRTAIDFFATYYTTSSASQMPLKTSLPGVGG